MSAERSAEATDTGTRERVGRWAEEAPFTHLLGIHLDELAPDASRLSLGFRHELSNGDGALHGGVAASTVVVAAGALARVTLGADAGPWHTSLVQVAYLAAALEEGLVAKARLLRSGRELAHIDVDVCGQSGKPVAKGVAIVRSRSGAATVPTPEGQRDRGESDPGPMGPFIGFVPFHATLGLSAEHMADGRSRIVMPASAATSDSSGAVHEGALLALLDTTGAMAAWAETGPGRYKASTPGMQARILDPEPSGDIIGYGGVVHRDRELLFCAVELCRADDGRLVADGAVNYRIVTPELAR